jgi:NADH-quinone oxidoreductase subunit G
VNEDWITDKDRFAFTWQNLDDRITRPLVRVDGELVEASWPDAIAAAAEGIRAALAGSGKKAKGAAVLPGGRVTFEDAYAYQKFARVVLGTNDVDARTRVASDEELAFLGHHVAGRGLGVTFAELEKAPAVLLVGFEPEDEGGVVFLRLKKAAHKVFAVAPWLSRGNEKLGATLIPTRPGEEGSALADLPADAVAALGEAGSVIVVGERAAGAAGALTEALSLAKKTGAKLAWIPRRAGERGAVEAGALPSLLPGGRDASKAVARSAVAAAWGVDELPAEAGRSAADIIAAAAKGQLGALIVGGVTPSDLTADLAKALEKTPFVVSLEVRRGEVSEFADVVLPVAPPSEKSGTFLNWEGRLRSFATAIPTDALSDHRVLDVLARELGVSLHTGTVGEISREISQLGVDDSARIAAPKVKPAAASKVTTASGGLVLATWHQLVDEGSLQDGEPYLAGTGRTSVARMSAATAEQLGATTAVSIKGSARASIDLPVVITDMPDGVVWVPTKSPSSWVARDLGVEAGAEITAKGVSA